MPTKTLTVVLLLLAVPLEVCGQATPNGPPTDHQVPISTQWLIDAAGPTQRASINSVYMLVCPKADRKGTGFLITNGAFNPGNSGGPLLLSGQNTVVGVVVWRMRILAPWTQILITGLKQSNAIASSGVEETMPNGTKRNLGKPEVTARILQEFYNTVQVMIGEATSVSELKAFIQEKGADVR